MICRLNVIKIPSDWLVELDKAIPTVCGIKKAKNGQDIPEDGEQDGSICSTWYQMCVMDIRTNRPTTGERQQDQTYTYLDNWIMTKGTL